MLADDLEGLWQKVTITERDRTQGWRLVYTRDDGAAQPDSVITTRIHANPDYIVGSPSSASVTVIDSSHLRSRVSNVARTAGRSEIDVNTAGIGGQVSQSFTTGPNPDGYLLDEIVVIGRWDDTWDDNRKNLPMRVTLRTDNDNGSPSDVVVARLSKSKGWWNWYAGPNLFKSNSPVPLRANTTYHIHLDAAFTLVAGTVDHAAGPDADGSGGWSLGKWRKQTANGWTEDADQSLRVAVYAYNQNTRVLLSNFKVGASAEIDVSTDLSTDYAKPYYLGFFPGDNPQGYYLTALELMVGADPNPGNSVRVELWRDHKEPDLFQPAARVAAFTNPDAWVEGVNLLTLPEAVWVQPSPNTEIRQGKYFIKIASVTGPLPLARTFSHTYEDPGSAPNWMNQTSLATNQAGGANALTVSFIYRLYGRINAGDGSVAASAPAADPNRITGLHISNSSTASGQTTYTLSWTPPAGGVQADYQYRYRNVATQNSFLSWLAATGATGASTDLNLDLTATNDYEIQMRVKVDGVYSAASNAVRTNPSTPGAPRNLTATAGPGEGRVTLSWSAPSFDGGTPVTGWQYREKASGETAWQYWQDMSGSDRLSRSYSLPVLPNPGDSVDFQVRAVNSWGTGVDSGAVGAAPLFRPRPVTDLAASVVLDQSTGSSDVQLNWSAPDGGPDIAKYQYQMRDWGDGSTGWRDIPGGVSAREHTVTGLEPRRTYIFRVRAVSAEGRSSWSASNMAVETPRPLPGAPELRVGNGLRGNRVTLEWTKPSDATQGYDYRMKAGSGAYGPWTAVRGNSPDPRGYGAWTALPGGIRHQVGGLTNGTQYTFQVRARNNVGSGPPSAEASRTPRAAVDPALRINDLTATSRNGRVTFTWTVAEDGNNLPRFYEFYWYKPSLPTNNPYWGPCGPNGPDYIQCLQGVTSFSWKEFSGFRTTYTDDLEHVQPRVVSIAGGRMTMEFTTYDLINHFRQLYPYSIDSPGSEKFYPDGEERNFGLIAWYSRDGQSFSDAYSNDLTLQVDAAASAETRTLVSNRNVASQSQAYAIVFNANSGAQPFRTGSDNAYELTSVWLEPDESTLPSDLEVTVVRSNALDRPSSDADDLVTTLVNPTSYTPGVKAVFLAPEGTILEGDTRYFVHFSSSQEFKLEQTANDRGANEDTQGLSDWDLTFLGSYDDNGVWRVNGGPGAPSDATSTAIQIAIVGKSFGKTYWSTPFNLTDRGGYATNNPVFVEGGTGAPIGRRVVPGRRPRAPVGAPVKAVYVKGYPNGDGLTYTLKGADADSFGIDSDTGQIRTAPGVTYDAQVKGSYAVKVEAAARQGASAEVDVTIRVDEGGGAPAPADYVSPCRRARTGLI